MDFTKEIELAALNHAKETLGDEQFSNVELESAKNAIMDDFKAGVDWLLMDQLESKTDGNMNIISAFVEHIQSESDLIIPEKLLLSFFNA